MTAAIEAPLLVVGGTGFLGSHVAEGLAAAGTAVVAASRRGRWPWGETPAGVECAAVDLAAASDEARLLELVRRSSGIVNLSGLLFRPGIPARRYRELHVDGTRRLVAAALAVARGAPMRLVHVSTTGVLGPTGPAARDESAAPRPSTPYETTKLEGERVALAGRARGLEVVVLRPGLVYGPRDLHLLPLYRSIKTGTFRPIAGGRARWQPIHVRDAARAVVAAAGGAAADGAVLHVAGSETVTVLDLARRIASCLGTRVRRPGLSFALAMAAGAMIEMACRPLGLDPVLSRSRVRTLTEDRLYAIDRAREELGFRPEIGLDEGIAETVAWYRERGCL